MHDSGDKETKSSTLFFFFFRHTFVQEKCITQFVSELCICIYVMFVSIHNIFIGGVYFDSHLFYLKHFNFLMVQYKFY